MTDVDWMKDAGWSWRPHEETEGMYDDWDDLPELLQELEKYQAFLSSERVGKSTRSVFMAMSMEREVVRRIQHLQADR